MKTLTATFENNRDQNLHSSVFDLSNNLIINQMKKLTNVSPFLLLLVPVFVMMVFSFTINTNTQEESAMKSSAKASSTLIKVTDKLLK